MGRGWQLSCTSVSMPLSQPSPLGKSTCPSLAQLQRSSSTARVPPFFICHLQNMLKMCIWSDCDNHLNGAEVWFCLADSNAPQIDPITCLIVATSCPPFFFLLLAGSTLHLSPASQMRQSYQHSRPSLYIQGLLTGGCCFFLSYNKVKWISVLFVLLCRFRTCKKRQCWTLGITFFVFFFPSYVGLSIWHFVAIFIRYACSRHSHLLEFSMHLHSFLLPLCVVC